MFIMRLATSFFLAWALLSLASAQEPSLKSDPKLAGKISLRLKNAPLPEALAEVGKNLAWSSSIADLKVTAFVKDEPRWLVMEKIADVLGCEWKDEKGVYRLILAPSDYSALQTYLKAEDALLQKQAKQDIDELLKLTSPSLESLQKRLDDLNKSGKPFRETAAERREILDAMDSRKRLMGDMFRRLTATDWSAFWQGKVLVSDADKLRVAVQFVPELKQVAWRSPAGPDGALMGLQYVVFAIPFLAPPSELAGQGFARKVLDWPTKDADLDSDESLKKAFGEAKEQTDPPYNANWRPFADELEKLFQETGRPIVADGFRAPAGLSLGQAGNLRQWIATVKKQFPSFVKIDGDWVLYRHGGFWRRRLQDPPEAAVRELEKKKELTLDDYANFASKLTPVQAMAFRVGFPPLTRFDVNPLNRAMPALRFYGSLSPSQRQAALSALAADNLTASQQRLFADALTEGVFSGADAASWASGLVAGSSLQGLTFALSAERVFPFGRPLPGGLRINGGPAGKSPEEQKVNGTAFFFGLDKERRIGYTVPVPPSGT